MGEELQQYSFVTIANRAVEGAIKNYWAKHYRQPQTLSLDVNGTDSENSAFYNIIELQTDDIEKLFDDDTTAIKRQAVAEAKEQLSETQFEIFSLLADGLSQKEIAQTLGKGGSTISLTIKLVRDKVASGKIQLPTYLRIKP